MGATRTIELFEGLGEDKRRALATLPMGIQEKLDAFLGHMKEIKFFTPDGRSDPEWRLFHGETRNTAMGAALRSASLAAGPRLGSWNAATTAASNAIVDAEVAESKRDAIKYAKRGVVLSAAVKATVDATLDAAGRMSGETVLAALLYVHYIVVSDLDFPDREKHQTHAQKCWEVWEKGYSLLCDVDGKLYVYCQDDKPLTARLLRGKARLM